MFIQPGRPALVLAPMDGVTDFLMRRVLSQLMPFSYCVTEFLRVSGLVPPPHVFRRSMPELDSSAKTAVGTPVQLQLLGGDPEKLALSAQRAVECGASAIDLNFGCPAPTVNRHDGGATLLQYPDRIEGIVRAVRGSVPPHIPVSAKLRLGWDDPAAIEENAERVALGGASWITIHGRTRFQGYTPPAYWQPIGRVRRSLNIPVVANGEIWSLDDLKRCQDETGSSHFMIGRGALADLTLVAKCAQHLGISRSADCSTGEPEWLAVLEHICRSSRDARESDRRTVSRLKQWLNYAHKRRTIAWFDRVKQAQSSKDLMSAVRTVAGNQNHPTSLVGSSSALTARSTPFLTQNQLPT